MFIDIFPIISSDQLYGAQQRPGKGIEARITVIGIVSDVRETSVVWRTRSVSRKDSNCKTLDNLAHPVNFPYGKKPEHPEKDHDFRQSSIVSKYEYSHICPEFITSQ